MGLSLRTAAAADRRELVEVFLAALGMDLREDLFAASGPAFEPDRAHVAVEDGRIVATASARSFELTLPGPSVLPCAGVTAVGTLPTHRRRGLARDLMGRVLADAAARDEPVAALIASEATIYRRFGFGPATRLACVEVRLPDARAPSGEEPGLALWLADADEALPVMQAVYESHRAERAGSVTRTGAWWDMWRMDPPPMRDGAGVRRHLLAYSGGRPCGYAAFRRKGAWARDLSPDASVVVEEVVGLTDASTRALWRFLLSLDLVRRVVCDTLPVDDPLPWMVGDPRQVRVQAVHDFLWVRPVDVARALAERSYGAAGTLVLQVHDPSGPHGSRRVLLESGPRGGAACRTTRRSPDLALDVADLGALLLGGVGAGTLVRAGRAREERPGAARRADAMFAGDRAPWCTTWF